MRAAIVHYHLRPGGVTSVIRGHSRSLTESGVPHVILSASGCDGSLPARTVPGLEYSDAPELSAADLMEGLRKGAEEALGGPPDVWHFHNHSLGKSPLLPEVVRLLAEAGAGVVLHLHDLAEDGRPVNHRLISELPHLYPVGPGIRYVFLNGKDLECFIRAGLPEDAAVVLPNPVGGRAVPPSPPGPPLVLYPSRSIRRKNLGEFLLLSALAPESTRFAISRAPENPAALTVHDGWKAFAERLRLPVDFDVVDHLPPPGGVDASYDAWLATATHLATTSVAEGFGMVFAEAPVAGRPLIGRDLPSNPHAGAHRLYDAVLVPGGWVDPEVLRHHLVAALTESYRLYDRALTPEITDRAWDALWHGDCLDFGNLPEAIQRRIIAKVVEEGGAEIQIHGRPAAGWMVDALNGSPPVDSPSPLPSPDLSALYASLNPRGEPAHGHLNPQAVLDAYLTPESFHFLLTPPPRIKAVIFDIYGTLLISASGGVKPDPDCDPRLAEILARHGFASNGSPTASLHEAVRRHHEASPHDHPEIDLRILWAEVLDVEAVPEKMILEIEEAWHPSTPMPEAAATVAALSAQGMKLGLLSNAQVNTLPALGEMAGAFDPELSLLSYQHGMAKPSAALFRLLAKRLSRLGIAPDETLFVGNDPRQDIIPAAAAGFRTALFTGHPDSLRKGACEPDLVLDCLSRLERATLL